MTTVGSALVAAGAPVLVGSSETYRWLEPSSVRCFAKAAWPSVGRLGAIIRGIIVLVGVWRLAHDAPDETAREPASSSAPSVFAEVRRAVREGLADSGLEASVGGSLHAKPRLQALHRARSTGLLRAVAVAVIAALSATAYADPPPVTPRASVRLFVASETEYYVPTKSDRRVQSNFENVMAGVSLFRGRFTVAGGATATSARGYITQYGDHFQDVALATAVGGAGPIFLLRAQPFELWRLSLALDLVGGLVLYAHRFPPGGDVYNFAWRLGGALALRLTDAVSVSTGARWMHVSNGQGLGPQNPSYEGVGFPLGVTYRF
jgi:hypothetical protein